MDTIKTTIAKAIIRILRPLIRLLMKHEISHHEFSEISKQAYIDIAYKHFSIPSRKTTYSRVSVLTGLTRKEVMRLSQLSEDDMPSTKRSLNRAAVVISGWMRDDDFLDNNNKPKVLPLRGDKSSFEQLVIRYGGNVTVGSIVDELERVEAIKQPTKDTIQLCSYGYIPQKDQPEKINILSMCAKDLLNTAVHNLEHDRADARFQRQVVYQRIPECLVEKFKAYSNQKSMDLLRDYNKWLSENEKQVPAKEKESVKRIGVGIYYIENDNE